jgi:hypothetical protein
MSILKRIGLSSKGPPDAPSGPETKSHRMNLDERMALRREMVFQVVRDVMGEWGLPETSYRFKVVPADPRGHTYSVMIDLPIQFSTDVSISQRELRRLDGLIDVAARERFKLRVVGVYWRVSESLVVDLSDQTGTRQRLPAGCNVVVKKESKGDARIAAVEKALARGKAFQVDGRIYDTEHPPLTPLSPEKSSR